jgi:ankyrin repeat protein
MYAPNAQIARVLIANRADLNFRDSNGQTALMHAINRPHPQLKSTANNEHYLNTYTRNYSATSSDQNNQEWLMSVYDRMELIRLLIRSVTTHNINLIDKSYSNALLLAVKANDIDTVRMLVPYGADINSVDQFGRTPLMHAVLLNNLDIVRLLIDNNVKKRKTHFYYIFNIIID